MPPEAALQTYFQLPAFRPGQREIIEAVLNGEDVLAIMPTGGGKSLCYQLPATLLPGITLVVSPLIALMKDQVDALQSKGIAAEVLNSLQSATEQSAVLRRMASGECRLLYVAPERFRDPRFINTLKQRNVSLVAVDEAHCISQWGHDFRPDYLRLGLGLASLGNPPVAAFTATATPEVQQDIIRALNLRSPQHFIKGFARDNLTFRVTHAARKKDKLKRILSLIRRHKCGIIYCATRKNVDALYEELAGMDLSLTVYHAGLSEEERHRAQELFMQGGADVVIATNAFGMGIDRSDIRFVVHYEIPGSLEAYYQEAGRAGRDGKWAVCELLYRTSDRRVQDFFIDGSNPDIGVLRDVYQALRMHMDEKNEVQASVRNLAAEVESKNEMAVSSAISLLAHCGVIERFDISGERVRGTRVLTPDLPATQLPIDRKALQEKKQRDLARLQSVIDYAEAEGCRQAFILGYFGEKQSKPCGCCDGCQRHGKHLRAPTDEEKDTLRKLLSGVARMSERLGAATWKPIHPKARILQMLLGEETPDVLRLELEQLSTFGILKEKHPDYLRALMESSLISGLLRQTQSDSPRITLTPLGSAVMFDQAEALISWPGEESGESRATRPTRRPTTESTELDERSAELFELLKRKRNALAAKRKVRPFYIFSNKVLEAIAVQKPLSIEEAMDIAGIGKVKAKREMPAFLPLIAGYAKSDS
ncbi:MAG: ATP-dependent DNA helicase RecQ [Opitutales bacterium]|nr:ATP-dependent DNA helicase RecQ [Opitutales bacterium]